MMGYVTWISANSMEYRGYIIFPGTVAKRTDDRMELVSLFYAPINAGKDEVFALGKLIVDELVAKEAESSPTTTPSKSDAGS